MRIKKILGTVGLVGNVLNQKSSSKKDAYSCDYVNKIIESGSNTNGSYVKYSDGTMICHRAIETTMQCNEPWGSLYVGKNTTEYNFPQTFIVIPQVIVEITPTGNNGCFGGALEKRTITTNSISGFAIFRGTSASEVAIKITLIAIGKWK